ncbi:hypothetical protein Hanom_Chr17g01583491 [Helianthus anomalus]
MCSSVDLKGVLQGYGDVLGIYIARKYDRLGKRFGFATFKVTRNRSDLEESLKDVWIGSYKLFIVPARFVDGQKVTIDKGKGIDKTAHGEKVLKTVNDNGVSNKEGVQDGSDEMQMDKTQDTMMDQRSFRDILLSKSPEKVFPEVKVVSEGKRFEEFYDSSIVAKVNSFDILSTLNCLLKDNWKGKYNIKYVGGLFVLVVFENRVQRDEFLGNKELWKNWFSWAEFWSGQALVVDRIVWLKITGLPIHIAEAKVFDDIAGLFGEVVQSADFSEEDVLSSAYVGVIPKSIDRISSKCKVQWKESNYWVLVEEDLEDWFPGCVVDSLDEEDPVVIVQEEVENVINVPNVVPEESGTRHIEESVDLPHLNGVCFNSVVEDRSVKSSKRKGGRYSKKKGVLRRSCSPLDKDRPKKRIREDNDMFDIDRLMFTN